MFDYLVIFSKTGSILYWSNQHHQQSCDGAPPCELLNQFIDICFLSPNHAEKVQLQEKKLCTFQVATDTDNNTNNSNNNNTANWIVAEWEEGGPKNYDVYYCSTATTTTTNTKAPPPPPQDHKTKDWIAVIFYKQILQNRINTNHVRTLLRVTTHEFAIFHSSVMKNQHQQQQQWMQHAPPPSMSLFHATFTALCRKVEQQQSPATVKQTSTLSHKHTDATINNNNNNTKSKTTTSTKKQQVWYDGTQKKLSSQVMESLDRSKKNIDEISDTANTTTSNLSSTTAVDRELQEARAAYLPTEAELQQGEDGDSIISDNNNSNNYNNVNSLFFGSSLEEETNTNTSSTNKSNTATSMLYGLWEHVTGNKILTQQDVQPIAQEMTHILASKNVAHETAQLILSDVQRSLIGKRLSSMARVKTAVRQALEKSIERIISSSDASNQKVDILRQVISKRENNKHNPNAAPFVIVVVGINGVGKSTSLAKLAYYLKNSGCSPAIAACDTFRSGAVEQLNVHAKCLDVPLFQRGYAKDPSAVARAAIAQAADNNNDVVLVDTAGRMQNNIPLMNALAKLTFENKPDLIIMVAEALVGNDGIDQLRMFDQAIGGKIDGIILTKFDTVSDKVGAALTMCHLSGKPVLFVGTGQKYNHLKRLNVQSVIKSLFS